MQRKRRRIVNDCDFILFVLCLSLSFTSSATKKVEDEQPFVFPSMQMEGVAVAKLDKGHVPMVEVVYRGQPPDETIATSTTVSSSETITQSPNKQDGGTWSFNTMNKPNYEADSSLSNIVTTTSPHQIRAGNSVSWNPDAIDVTVNPNKGRKSTTDRENDHHHLIISTTTEKKYNFQDSQPGIKDNVLNSKDYQKWLQTKNSFLFEPALAEEAEPVRTTLAPKITTTKAAPTVSKTKQSNHHQVVIAGSQAPELEIQHEMNHFPSLPFEANTKRVPRDYLTFHDNGGQSYQIINGGSASTVSPPAVVENELQQEFSPTVDTFVPLSGTERMEVENGNPPIIMTLPPELQDTIPDGYELVPVDRITDEYEIVPWTQVKTLLNISIGPGPEREKKHTGPVSYPSTTYGPPTSPYKEAGYSQDNYLPAFHSDLHDDINEVLKTWYNPPPISPDLPTLFYDDTGQIKHMPKPKLPGLVLGHDPHAPPKSIKGLGFKHADTNVIHFGTDFGVHHPPHEDPKSHINGYKVSTVAPPPVPPFIKNIFHQSTTTPYPLWNSPKTTPKPIYYSTSTTPYSKVKYSTPKPSTVKSLPASTYAPPPHPTHHAYTPTPSPSTVSSLDVGYVPPVIVTPQPNHRRPDYLKDLNVPEIHFTPLPTSVHYSTTVHPEKHGQYDSKSYSIFNFYTTPSPIYKPEVHDDHIKAYHPPKIEHVHVKSSTPVPIKTHHKPYHPPPTYDHELHPPPPKIPHDNLYLHPPVEPHHDPYHHTPKPVHHEYHPPKPHHDPYHEPPKYHSKPHEPHHDPYHVPHHEPHHEPPHYHPKPPGYHSKPHTEHLHPHYSVEGNHPPAHAYHYHPDHYLASDSDISRLPPKLKSYLPVGFHSVYHGPGIPPKYPPVPLGEPPSYPPAPYLLGLNKTEKVEKIKIEDVDALKEALRKAGVGPGSKKKVYLVKEESGETSVQISLPVEDLFGDQEDFDDRSSEALDLSQQGRFGGTTPLTTSSSTTTTISTTTKGEQSAQLMKFEMNDFWLQMQKLFKPGQILMADKKGVKLNNILISKEQTDYENEEEDEEVYEDEEYEEYEEEDRSSQIEMDLKQVNLDLRDLIRGKQEVLEVPKQDTIQVFVVDKPRRKPSLKSTIRGNPLDVLPTDRIFVPDEQFQFDLDPPDLPVKDNVFVVTPQPQTTTFTAYPSDNPIPVTTTTTQNPSKEVLESLRSSLDGLVNTVNGLNNTVIQAMREKSKEIRKEDPSNQIRSLQAEIAGLTKMVHDLKMQKQSNDFMSIIAETQNMIKKQEEKQIKLQEQQQLQQQQHFQQQKELLQQQLLLEQQRERERVQQQLLLEDQRQQSNFVTPSPPPITTRRPIFTTTASTTTTTKSTTSYNWFTSDPVTRTTSTTSPPLQTFQVSPTSNIDTGLLSNINEAPTSFFGSMIKNQNTNSIDLDSAKGVEEQQESFLRLTLGENQVNQPFKPHESVASVATVTSGPIVSNDIFPSTLVSSSVSFGSQTSDRLPPGSAGFGTVEAVDLGAVNIQVGNQQQQSFVVGSNLQATQSLANLQQQQQNLNTFQPQNQNLNTFQQQQILTNPQQQQSFADTFDTLPTYGQTSVNIQTIPSNNFGPTLRPSDALPTYGNSQSFNTDNALPVYGQQSQQQILPNQFNTANFRPSGSLTVGTSQAWKGANHQQQFLGNQAINLNGQSQLTPTFQQHSNERPVRFPSDASNRYDIYYGDETFDNQAYYDLPYDHYTAEATRNMYKNPESANYYTTTSSPNIIAELAKYSKKNNLIHRPGSGRENVYIQYPGSHELEEPDKELIFYPSGQLLQNGNFPTTIGPQLRQYLSSQSLFTHGQTPHYVFARKKNYEGKTELFDPLLEGDEIIERSDDGEDDVNSQENENGLLPSLIRTAKDDLKLVGDVIKMAFSKKR